MIAFLLKIFPSKDIIYVLALLGVIGWYFAHNAVERADGAKAEAAKVAVISQKAEAQVNASEAQAQVEENQNVLIYEKAVSVPAVADLGIVCKHATGNSQVPAPIPGNAGPLGVQSSDSGSGPGYDPTGAALTRGREADAQITYLQGRIHELESEMNKGP